MPSSLNSPARPERAPLHGLTIAVTRPRAQASDLSAAIQRLGGTPLICPLLEIEAIPDTARWQREAGPLTDAAFAIFISPNAVNHALPALLAQADWPTTLRAATVGPGTVKALQRHGIDTVLAPVDRFDSEGLLACPELAETAVRGQRILIFRGDGGRELLADTLRERGAEVRCLGVYRRLTPRDGLKTLAMALQRGPLDALTLSSSEALRHLWNGLDETARGHLQDLPVFVPHPRIAEVANTLGLTRIILTEGADAGLIAGLCAYNCFPLPQPGVSDAEY